MNLSAHLLSELAGLAEVIEKLLRTSETAQTAAQQHSQHIHQKLDEWIQTNRALTQSNQALLKLITANSEALNQLTTSYERSISSWQDLQPQPMLSGEALNALTSSLSESLLPALQKAIQERSHPSPAQLQAGESQKHRSTSQVAPSLPQTAQTNLRLSANLIQRATAPLAALGALLLATGSGVGFAFAQVQQPIPLYVTDRQEPLTLEEADRLAWATSDEGQFARNLMDWNSGVLDSLSCTEEVKRLGVTLKVQGRPATYQQL